MSEAVSDILPDQRSSLELWLFRKGLMPHLEGFRMTAAALPYFVEPERPIMNGPGGLYEAIGKLTGHTAGQADRDLRNVRDKALSVPGSPLRRLFTGAKVPMTLFLTTLALLAREEGLL